MQISQTTLGALYITLFYDFCHIWNYMPAPYRYGNVRLQRLLSAACGFLGLLPD